MDTVILVLLLIFAVILIGLVLMQRSEGGGLGIGGGGGNGMGGRPKANPLARLTWYVAAGFLGCSLALTVLSSVDSANDSVITLPPIAESGDASNADGLLPPSAADDLVPPAPSGDDLTPPATTGN